MAECVRVPEPPAAAKVVGGLRKDFGSVQAVGGISADLPVGRILGLLGPDGAGRTTFDPAPGRLDGTHRRRHRVLGRKRARKAARPRREVGYMPQRSVCMRISRCSTT